MDNAINAVGTKVELNAAYKASALFFGKCRTKGVGTVIGHVPFTSRNRRYSHTNLRVRWENGQVSTIHPAHVDAV